MQEYSAWCLALAEQLGRSYGTNVDPCQDTQTLLFSSCPEWQAEDLLLLLKMKTCMQSTGVG
jgi:hypothetical protein